jgi:ssRNA-specific RNase YbeY (16S rRNA maturation enzyme)
MGVEIANESGTAVAEASIAAAARFAMDRMGVSPLAELSMLLVAAPVMADLHQRWMDLPGPTDVMAFPMDETEEGGLLGGGRPDSPPGGPELLGDIVLCPDVAIEQAAAAGHCSPCMASCICWVTTMPIPPKSRQCSRCKTVSSKSSGVPTEPLATESPSETRTPGYWEWLVWMGRRIPARSGNAPAARR